MKRVLLINGSPRQNGRTMGALKLMEQIFLDNGIEVQWFQVGNKPIRGCIGCEGCEKKQRCVFTDDQCNALIEAMLATDAIVVGTPVYFAGPSGALCALMDRAFYAAGSIDHGQMLLKGKLAAAVAACWRAGATCAQDRLNRYFTPTGMTVVGSSYWNGYQGEQDTYGAEALKYLAKNMSQLLLEQK